MIIINLKLNGICWPLNPLFISAITFIFLSMVNLRQGVATAQWSQQRTGNSDVAGLSPTHCYINNLSAIGEEGTG